MLRSLLQDCWHRGPGLRRTIPERLRVIASSGRLKNTYKSLPICLSPSIRILSIVTPLSSCRRETTATPTVTPTLALEPIARYVHFIHQEGIIAHANVFSLSRAITGALVMRAMDPLASITRTRKLLYSIRFRDLYSNSFAQRWFVLLPKPQRVYLSQQRPGRFHLHRPQRPGLQEVGSEVRCFYI